MMKSLTQYRYSCEVAIFNYLKDNDLEKLVADLSRIENIIIDKSIEEIGYDETEDMTLWFKFFSGDTVATDISNIKHDLEGITNREYMLEKFRLTIELDPDNELQVYFS